MDFVRMFRNTREYLTPVLQESEFAQKGVLTPEEFVRAGDQLVRTCPTWQWCKGEPSKIRPYLPPDKQYLCTRGVPSFQRVTVLNAATLKDEMLEGTEGDGADGWCAPELIDAEPLDQEVLVDFDDLGDIDNDGKKEAVDVSHGADQPAEDAGAKVVASAAETGDDDEYADMEDESLALDESAATSAGKAATADSASTGMLAKACIGAQPVDDNVVRSRRYDVSITYDKYYRTPRVWLFGYDENGSPLKPEAIFSDIMQDYAKKTVTIDPHPHISKPHGT
jgi:ubiquitin-like-conjugating enzyme ATG3